MAGAKHTDRHLQRMMLRGLLLPAAAAGAIVLGASAASADEGSTAISPAGTAGGVQAATETAGTPVTSAVDEALAATPSDTTIATGGDTTAMGSPSADEGPAVPPTEPRSMPAESSAIEPPTPSPARQPSSGPGSGGSAVTPVETVAESTVSIVETTPAPAGPDAEGPATPPADATEVAGTLRDTVPGAGAVKQAAAPAPDPLADPLSEPLTEATPTFEAVARAVPHAVKQDPDPPRGRISEPVGETTPVFDRLLDEVATAPARTVEQTGALGGRLLETAAEPARVVTPALDAAASLPEQALAPAAATAPIFTGVADGLLADIGGAGALLTGTVGTTTGAAAPLLTPLVETTPIFDQLTRDLLTPVLDTMPLSGEVTSLTSVLAGPQSSPAATAEASAQPVWPSLSPVSAADEPPTAETAGWPVGWTPTYDAAGSTISTTPASASPVPTVVPLLVGPLLIGDEPGQSETTGLDARTVGALSSLSLLGTQPTVAESAGTGSDPLPSPDRNLLSQVGGLVEAVTATGGGTQGASGSTLLLLLAVVGAALLLRIDGLAQLTPGTATALSSRSAQVQDRPG